MRMRVPVLLLLVLSVGQAQEALTAQEVFRRAVEAQGRITRAQIEDVYLEFNGHIVSDDGEHAVRQRYWYRSDDRSFRLLTEPKASRKRRAESGVLGESGYWEREGDRILRLTPANRVHRKSIRTIDKERTKFERTLKLVLLARLEGGQAKIRYCCPAPVRLEKDLPYSARSILGDRKKLTYHVLDIERENEPRYRLFVESRDFSVRKVVQFRTDQPEKPEFYYYFGPHWKVPEALNLTLPQFLSVHGDLPTTDANRRETSKGRGNITLRLNRGLKDPDLKPGG